MATIYYRSCGATTFPLYRVEAASIPNAPGGGYDLSAVPEGKVSGWDGLKWVEATLPPVGHDAGHVCHTKNKAGVGAPKSEPEAKPPAEAKALPRADAPKRR